jgi:hypothetical protein
LSLNGYVDDVRISKGIGRYPYNFTPPTAEFPNIGGTVTLTADPYFDYTTLLLPGNGTNGAQNNTFLDSSTNAFSITRNGNTTQGTFSPFSQTGWGNYFDGSGDFLQVADAAPMELGSGNWTIEMWVNTLNSTAYSALFTRDDGGTTTGSYVILLNTASANGIVTFWSADVNSFTAAVLSSGSVNCRDGTWHHIAVVRNSNTLTMYIDGTATSTASFSGSFGNTAQPLKIGSETGYARDYTGYISNVRLVVGSAVYTANFTPSTTPLTAITNTSLLTCQSNRFIDNSTNAFAITRNGDVSVQAFSPFNPTAAWSASTNGGSGYFDGSGDYLTAPYNSAISFGSESNWTIEFWFYTNDTSGTGTFIWGSNSLYAPIAIVIDAGVLYVDLSTSGSAWAWSGSTAVTAGQWYHIAIVRNGATTTAYRNGTSFYSASSVTLWDNSQALGIGARNNGTNPMKAGYMAGLRLVKGTAVYTASFTAPTAPPTAITNTSLLLNYTNAGIYDATSKNDLETVGNAQISTTQSKFGNSSMYFDGTDDRLPAPASVDIAIGTADFTIEGWFYTASPATNRGLFQISTTAGGLEAGNTNNLAVYCNSSVLGVYYASTFKAGTTSISANTWTHFALVRYSGSTKLYVNGIADGGFGTNADTQNYTGKNVCVGGYFSTSYLWGGYIQDFRITKGIARYTSNFTPPTTAFLTL